MPCSLADTTQGGPPTTQAPYIATTLIRPSFQLRQCNQRFPSAFVNPPNVERVNKVYGGWNISVSNLYFVSGERDQWRYATLSAPGVIAKSTPEMPIVLSPGYHCGDLCACVL
jgi:hypothetical protein